MVAVRQFQRGTDLKSLSVPSNGKVAKILWRNVSALKGWHGTCSCDGYLQAGVSALCNKPKSSSPAAVPPEGLPDRVPCEGVSFPFLLGFGVCFPEF